ncbi:cache domain-containing sensor histidine kinase [Paenibacillus hamazuiensis]|uniref:cache domain-containing sensor histidine kinase n=1 Tax=Paenibacillus hamazuiensis TaxID=2936508 RepID=UPI00200CFD3D|nr:sensor histidine kinase [Paenibacillus hamazuiensis]
MARLKLPLRLPNMNNWPIRYKLIAHFLLISILPSIGLGFLIGLSVERVVERNVNDNTLQLIDKVNKSLDFYVSNMQNISYLISANPEFRQFLGSSARIPESGQVPISELDRYNMGKLLQSISSLYPEVAGILVAKSNGDYFSNDMYARTDRPLTEEFWYAEAVANRGIFKNIGHPEGRNVASHANYQKDEVVSMVRAILDPNTQGVLGVVLIDLKLRVIAETVKDVRLGKSGYLMIVDKYGEKIYSPSHPLIDQLPRQWFSDDGGSGGMFLKKVGGEELQFIYRKSPFTDWTTVGVFPAKETVAEIREIRLYVIVFVFIACVLGIAASHYLSYSISRPILKLTDLMRKAESGDLAIRSADRRTDEIGMLGRGLNHMLVQIHKLLTLTEQQEKQKREAELKSLQAHIKPHFLYNTLDTIHWLSRKRGADDVAEMVASLSKLFRIALSRGNEMIPLADEIEHIRSYLKIQQTRYREKLHYEIDMPGELAHLPVLKIILQPIIENAIYHGIKERRGPGHIYVQVRENEGHLEIRIEDDGRGMTADQLAELSKGLGASYARLEKQDEARAPVGYGIMNVQDRIVLSFGAPYGLSIVSEPGNGTVVTVTHPIIRVFGKEAGHEAAVESAHHG